MYLPNAGCVSTRRNWRSDFNLRLTKWFAQSTLVKSTRRKLCSCPWAANSDRFLTSASRAAPVIHTDCSHRIKTTRARGKAPPVVCLFKPKNTSEAILFKLRWTLSSFLRGEGQSWYVIVIEHDSDAHYYGFWSQREEFSPFAILFLSPGQSGPFVCLALSI